MNAPDPVHIIKLITTLRDTILLGSGMEILLLIRPNLMNAVRVIILTQKVLTKV